VSNYKFDLPPPDKLDEVVKAYDNSIKYNNDSFFENLVPDHSAIPNDSVIIYTGDHGQNLYVNGTTSHGGKSKEEASVRFSSSAIWETRRIPATKLRTQICSRRLWI
jgi:hypothetical protein